MIGNNMDKDPLVSVIMNCHNSEKYISEAIDSVLSQIYNNWELVVWDNKSTDNTRDIVNSYSDHRIKYYFSDEFTALGEARNLAIKKSKGDLIGFLDADDLWLSDKLKMQVPAFNDEKIGICICDSYFFNETGIIKQIYKKKKPPTGMVFKELLARYFISLETAMIRRSSLDTLNEWFDPRFNMIEEYDLFVRIGYQWEVEYIDKVLAMWRYHKDSWTWRYSKNFPIERQEMLKKLENVIPEFNEKFRNEIYLVNRTCDFENARILWAENNNSDARILLRPYAYSGLKWYVVYIMTYLPYIYFKKLWNQIGGIS
jgi:glycosyltransferase involved in cell wall biosynthesis